MSAFGGKADMALLRNFAFAVAIGCKADMACCSAYVGFLTQSRHRSPRSRCYVERVRCGVLLGANETARVHSALYPLVADSGRAAQRRGSFIFDHTWGERRSYRCAPTTKFTAILLVMMKRSSSSGHVRSRRILLR